MMDWERMKRDAYESYLRAKAVRDVDEQIIELLEIINAHPHLFTTSSCAGRAFVIKRGKTKEESKFLGKWHGKIKEEDVLKVIGNEKDNLWFCFEPFIIHITAKDIQSAKLVLEAMQRAGVKKGGIYYIGDVIRMEIEGTQRMEVPLEGIDKEYVRVLVEKANEKWEKNFERLMRFKQELEKVLR